MSGRRGFTVIELLIVMLIIGILAQIAIPRYQQARKRAVAAKIAAEIDVIRKAAFTYHTEAERWPGESRRGRAPAELVPYLPGSLTFSAAEYDLDWEMWITPRGTPRRPRTGVLLGLTVFTRDADIGRYLVAIMGGQNAFYTRRNRYTFIILAS